MRTVYRKIFKILFEGIKMGVSNFASNAKMNNRKDIWNNFIFKFGGEFLKKEISIFARIYDYFFTLILF